MALKSPVLFHEYWGIVSVAGELPNVSGAAIQSSAVTVGDIAWVAADKKLYQCTTATVGAAVWDDLIDDPNAIHADVAGEINALTVKGTPTTADVMLLEDSAAVFAKKKSPISGMPTALDAAAIHGDVSAEISPLTEKTAPVAADNALIEDSGAANVKKMIEVGDIITGPEAANLWQRPITPHAEDDEFDSTTIDSSWAVYRQAPSPTAGSLISGVDAYDTTFSSGTAIRADAHQTTRRSWMLVQPPATSDYLSIAKPITVPTNLLMMARLKFNQRQSVDPLNDHWWGIGFFQDSSGNASYSNSVLMILSSRTATEEYALAYKRVAGSGSDLTYSTDVDEQGQALEYAAIHKIGITYHCWLGTPNGNWIYMGAKTHSTTMGHVGFMTRNASGATPVGVMGVDFIRFVETDNFLF